MSASFPDGIGKEHIEEGTTFPHPPWLALWVLGAFLVIALFGPFGGGAVPERRVDGAGASLTIRAPQVLRNGEILEIGITGEARRAIRKPVIAISSEYWRDVTINAIIPAPASETFQDGSFMFEFEPLDPGETLAIKIDGQINPRLFAGRKGTIAFRDGQQILAEIPVRMRVLP